MRHMLDKGCRPPAAKNGGREGRILRIKIWKLFVAVGAAIALLTGGHALQDHSLAVKKVPTSKKLIAITFDDGPHPSTTPALLTILEAKQARATFFLLGQNAERFPSLVGAIAAAGQEIASHGYHHRFPNKQPREEFFEDLARAEAVITQAAPAPTLFRPAGGGYNDPLVRELAQRGYTTVLWSIDPRDWERRSPEKIAASVIQRASPGAIVLLHEGEAAANTPAAVTLIIDHLQAQGYQLVTVGELLRHYEIRP